MFWNLQKITLKQTVSQTVLRLFLFNLKKLDNSVQIPYIKTNER